MINHFRTRLMNLSDVGTVSEYVCPGFTAISLPSQYAAFRALLFPSSSRSDIVQRANSYTMLMMGTNLDEVFKLYDNRINYTVQDLFNFQTASGLIPIANSTLANSATTVMINLGASNPKYLDMYQESPMQLQRLAGLIALYSAKLN